MCNVGHGEERTMRMQLWWVMTMLGCATSDENVGAVPQAIEQPYVRLDLQLDDSIGANTIGISPSQGGALSGRLRLTFENDPRNPHWPMKLVALDALALEGASIALDNGKPSGALGIERDFTRAPSGGYNPSTGALWAHVPVKLTAEAFLDD